MTQYYWRDGPAPSFFENIKREIMGTALISLIIFLFLIASVTYPG